MKYKYIDALRGIAILMVIIVHTSQYGIQNLPEIFKSIISLGAKGVQLFFMTSAFTLFLSHEYHLTKELYVNTNFFIRRLFRIAPMYFLGIIYFSYINGFNSIGVVIANFFFLHGLSPYYINELVPGGWSITVEMTFYAIVPFLISKMKNFNMVLIFTLSTLLLSIILNSLLIKYPLINSQELWKLFLYYYFPNQLPIFCLGIISYFIIIKNDFKVKNIVLTVIASTFLLSIMVISYFRYNTPFPIHFIAGIGFLGLTYMLAKNEYVVFVNRFTCYIGKVSYSSYLIHFAVLAMMAKYNFVDFVKMENQYDTIINYAIRLVIVISITITIASFTYLYLEVPFINIGKKIIQRIENKKYKDLVYTD